MGLSAGRRSVSEDCVEELEAREEIEVDEVLRLRRERSDDVDPDLGAAAGMTTPDFRMADRENLGALLARFGSSSSLDKDDVTGTVSTHRPLGFAVDGGDGALGLGTLADFPNSRRGDEDHKPASVLDFLPVGLSRSTTESATRPS